MHHSKKSIAKILNRAMTENSKAAPAKIREAVWFGCVLTFVLAAQWFSPSADAREPHWGTFKQDRCVAIGQRQYSARLLDAGDNWEKACDDTGAVISTPRGKRRFSKPARCKKVGVWPFLQMWGEFDVPDPSCPHWGTISPRNCTALGVRKFEAVLEDIPDGVDWQSTCEAMPAAVHGTQLDRPTRCVKTDLVGMGISMRGEFDVRDTSCVPVWKPFQKKECTGLITRQYSSRLDRIPDGLDWEDTCTRTPAEVNGVEFARPTRCVKTDIVGFGLAMWGEFDISDTSCIIDWHYPWFFFGMLVVFILILILSIKIVSRKSKQERP
jgi:hypothetical protein